MTLGEILRARILAQGPLTLGDYMAECLLHPKLGYYATRDPFGQAGDFITAPEISQMFGELVGLALAQSWLDQGAPRPFVLAEPGPGRGTLMADIWRATRGVPGFHDSAQVVLIEASAHLRIIQHERLAGMPVTWRDNVADLPDAPLWLVANEFFDALPVRQFQRAGPLWAERVVGLVEDRLTLGLTPPASRPDLDDRLDEIPENGITEICPQAGPIMAELARRIARHGGAVLIVDYGDWGSRGDTFQALRAQAFADPFADPGQADLTAHVDFRALARAASPLRPSALTDQGALLTRLGIATRAQALAAHMTPTERAAHWQGLHRLVDPSQMGTLFKALALVPPAAPPPPGFDAKDPTAMTGAP